MNNTPASGFAGSANPKELKTVAANLSATNFRPDPYEPSALMPAAPPAKLRTDGWVPLGELFLPDIVPSGAAAAGCRTLFWLSGGTMGVSFHTAPAPEDALEELRSADVRAIGVFAGEPLNVSAVEPGMLRVLMKDAPAQYMSYTEGGTFTIHGSMPVPKPFSFRVEAGSRLSEQIGAVKLSGSGVRGGAVSSTDVRILTAAVQGAYARLSEEATHSGMFLQPVLARYRLEDANGDLLLLSPPVMLSAGAGFQCLGETDMAVDSDGTLAQGGALSAQGYAVALTGGDILPEPWCHLVRRCVVELSPQIEPVDSAASVRVRSVSNGGAATLHVALPGATTGGARRALLLKALRKCRYADALSIEFPLRAPIATLSAGASPALLFTERTPVPTVWRDSMSFSAVDAAPGMLIGCNPLEHPFAGFPVETYAVGEESGGYQGVVTLEKGHIGGGGERIVATSYGLSGAPSALSPVLVYPDSTATSLSIAVAYADGRTLHETYPLTPIPSAGIAVYVAPDPAPMLPTGSGGSISAATAEVRARRRCGAVAIFPPQHQSEPYVQTEVMPGMVQAVEEAPRGSGAWDFSRRKLIAFGTGGIWLLTLDSRNSLHGLSRLDSRPVCCRKAVAAGGGEKGLTLLAIAGCDLVEVSASGVKTMLRGAEASEVAYSAAFDEILISGDAGQRRVSRSGMVSAVAYEDADDSGDIPTAIVRRLGIASGRFAGKMILRIDVGLTASRASGLLEVYAHNGGVPEGAICVAAFEVDGSLGRPVSALIPMVRRRYVEFRWQGHLSPDARWRPDALALLAGQSAGSALGAIKK